MDYREAGVDISAADEAKARIKALARGTFNAGVLSEIGSFGGMFRPDLARYAEPVLVASTDGVGTKIKVGDRRRACTTPSATTSSRTASTTSWSRAPRRSSSSTTSPLGRMDPDRVEADRRAASRAGCTEFGCPLIGGETAEMPGTYARRRLRPGRLHRRRRGQARRRCRRGRGEAGDLLLGPALGRACTRTATRLARKVLFDAARPQARHASARARHHRGRGAPGAASRLPAGARAAARARQDPRARPHHRAAASPATSRASCRTGWARASGAARGRCPPLFRLIQAGRATSPTTRCSAPSTWASAWWSSVAPGGPARGRALPRAPRRDELRHRLRGARGAGVRSSELAVTGQARRRPRSAAAGRNLQALIDAAARSRWAAEMAVVDLERGRRARARARAGRRHPALAAAITAAGRAESLRPPSCRDPARARRRPRLPGRLHAARSRPSFVRRLPRAHPERRTRRCCRPSRAWRRSAQAWEHGVEGERRDRAPGGRGPRHRAPSSCRRRCRCGTTTRRDSLAARILEAEHRIYPRAVRDAALGRCRVEGRRVWWRRPR